MLRWQSGGNRVAIASFRDQAGVPKYLIRLSGWVAERLKAPVLKTGRGASLSWVRIPPHPPLLSSPTFANRRLNAGYPRQIGQIGGRQLRANAPQSADC